MGSNMAIALRLVGGFLCTFLFNFLFLTYGGVTARNVAVCGALSILGGILSSAGARW